MATLAGSQHVDAALAMLSSGEQEKAATFEWLLDWDAFGHLLAPKALGLEPGNAAVLEVGCGTSTLAVELRKTAGYHSVVSVDSDAGCVEHMRSKYPDVATWEVADITSPTCETSGCGTAAFALAVDKGTLDCILCEIGPAGAARMLREIHRTIQPSGIYAVISLHPPDLLLPILTAGGLFAPLKGGGGGCQRISAPTRPDLNPHTFVLLRRTDTPMVPETALADGQSDAPTAVPTDEATVGAAVEEGGVVDTCSTSRGAGRKVVSTSTTALPPPPSLGQSQTTIDAMTAEILNALDHWHIGRKPLLTGTEESRIRSEWPRLKGGQGKLGVVR
jgi:SAM-dependent methyltransferase